MSHTLTVVSFSKKKKKVSRTIVQTGGGLFGRDTDWTVFKGLYLLTARLSVFSFFCLLIFYYLVCCVCAGLVVCFS